MNTIVKFILSLKSKSNVLNQGKLIVDFSEKMKFVDRQIKDFLMIKMEYIWMFI